MLALGRLDGVSSLLPDRLSSFTRTSARRLCSLHRSRERSRPCPTCCSSRLEAGARRTARRRPRGLRLRRARSSYGVQRVRERLPALESAPPRDPRRAPLAWARPRQATRVSSARSQNWIGGPRPGVREFVPPPPEPSRTAWPRSSSSSMTSRSRHPAQGGAGARAVRDDPPVPRWQRSRRTAADHAAARVMSGALREPLLYLSLVFEAEPRDLLRARAEAQASRSAGRSGLASLEGVKRSQEPPLATPRRGAGRCLRQDRARIEAHRSSCKRA